MDSTSQISEPTIEQRVEMTTQPAGRTPVMYHKWRDLLFLHWAYDPRYIQSTLPPGLYVDVLDAQAYVGVVPFFMFGVRPRFVPPLPLISNFLELNLRTYVFDEQGNPGVWFYSLNANQWLGVQAARVVFGLAYFYASMHASKDKHSGEVRISCRRKGADPDLRTSYRYRGTARVPAARPGSLEFFLIERYLLFSYRSGELWKGRVYHPPYTLQNAEVPELDDRLFILDGLQPPNRPPEHILFSPGVDVQVFMIER
jgi:uncharacterized protein